MQKNNKPGRIIKGTAKQPTLKEASGVWTLDEAMQAHRANAWPQPNLLQPIPKSVRNSLSKTAYFTMTPGRNGNNRRFTLSWWFKRNNLASTTTGNQQQHLFYSYDGSRLFQVFFERSSNTNPDYLVVYGAGADLRFAPIFRDNAAWYHVVIAVDVDNPTTSNTIRGWLNGQLMTVLGSQGGSPGTPSYFAQTANLPVFQSSAYQRVGGASAGGTFDGQFAEVNLIDGYAIDASHFGTTGTDGVWIPKPYTGSYGTNGCYLPFNNTALSQYLGYDYSNFTNYDVDADPYRSSVALHLTGNGPAGSQNNTFVDSSPNNLTVSRGGNATQGSFSPFGYDSSVPYSPSNHGGSVYFGGPSASDYLSLPSNTAWSLTGDFTLETWLYPTSYTGTYMAIAASTINNGIWFGILSTGLGLRRYNVADVVQASSNPPINTWTHVAVTRAGSTIRLFVNGVLLNSATDSGTFVSDQLVIGSDGAPGSSTQRWPGYISNFRIVKGTAIYTSSFVPPAKPFGTKTNNLFLFSEDFKASPWFISNASVVANAAIAPDGTPTASKLLDSTSNTRHNIGYTLTVSANTQYSASVYLKAGELTSALVYWGKSGAPYTRMAAVVNLANGTVTSASTGITVSETMTMTDAGNGWYRLQMSGIFDTTSTDGYIEINTNSGLTAVSANYVGTGTKGFYVWGVQVEQSSTVTAYTPTPINSPTAPSVLLKFENAAVVDSAAATTAITVGSATITSASKFGSGALAFNGSSHLVVPATTGPTNFGTGDFTIECWWKSTGSQASYAPVISQGFTGSPPAGTWGLKVSGGGQNLQFTYDASLVNVGQNINSSINPNDSNWHHIAVCRNYSKIYMFIDGALVGNYSIPSNQVVGNSTSDILIGYQARDAAYLNGTVDDLRITKGVARYQDNFTPPARALPEIGGKSFIPVNVNAGTVKAFTTVGTTSWTAPSDVNQVEVLVVAGGGGGGSGTSGQYNGCGGGGAGGLIYNSAYSVTPGQTYTVIVGNGGIPGVGGSSRGGNGGNSVFGALTAIGGGGGGSYEGGNTSLLYGSSGGSGGGAKPNSTSSVWTGGAGTPGQGFAGGQTGGASNITGGSGGGGAGGVGSNATSTTGAGGNGGPGLYFGISGSAAAFAGGGGGGGYPSGQTPGTGGVGGGGSGIGTDGTAASGTANTGGGGGGGGRTGGAGGSGIVIVRYTTSTEISSTTDDSIVDSPTNYGHDYQQGGEVVGNYCTLNPLDTETDHSFANGNLTLYKAASNWSAVRSTMAFSSGKWYFETTYNDSWDYAHVGVLRTDVDTYAGQTSNAGYVGNYLYGWAYQQDARIWNNNTLLSGSGAVRSYAGDICMCAVDMDNGKIWWGRNGVWFNAGNPAAGTGAAYSNVSGEVSPAFSVYGNAKGISVNFGQRPWVYQSPAGFNAINTKNLPIPTGAAATPNQYFDTVLYTGNGVNTAVGQTISSLNFRPDLIWIKGRSNATTHWIQDTVRGLGYALQSNATAIDAITGGGDVSAVSDTGFTVSYANDRTNFLNYTYAAWCWKAGGAAVTNTAGSITSQVSANTTSGFSVVTYTGNSTAGATVGHGLNAAPKMIILKSRGPTARSWGVYHAGVGNTSALYLDLINAPNTAAFHWNNTSPTSTVFTLGNGSVTNSAENYVAYCWAEIPGFSKFGTYLANGNVDGTFIYTGFKPRFILGKDTAGTNNWWIFDSTMKTYNGGFTPLNRPNLPDAELTNAERIDFLSNGFKIRIAPGSLPNDSSTTTYIYAAFAENPFKTARGR